MTRREIFFAVVAAFSPVAACVPSAGRVNGERAREKGQANGTEVPKRRKRRAYRTRNVLYTPAVAELPAGRGPGWGRLDVNFVR